MAKNGRPRQTLTVITAILARGGAQPIGPDLDDAKMDQVQLNTL